MTAELLKNLIPAQTQSKTVSKTAQNIVDKADKAFSNLLDDINKKYSQKDTQTTTQSDIDKQQKVSEKNSESSDTSEKTANSKPKEFAQKTDNSSVKNSDDTTEQNNSNTKSDFAADNKEKTNTDEETTASENALISNDINLALNTLNNLLLAENTQTSTSNNIPAEDVSNTALEANTTETDGPSDKFKSLYTPISEKMLPKTKTIDGTDTTLTVKSELPSEMEKKLAEKAATEETADDKVLANIELQDADNLVKFEQAADSAIDDLLVSDKKTDNTGKLTKISQDLIDNLDVTVRSIEKTPDMSQFNSNAGFGSTKGNAQEDIIKMTLGSVTSASTSETVTLPEFTMPDISDIDPQTQALPGKTIVQTAAPAQPKAISNADILTQINTKVTLPQEDATSKVSIILKPENLGKVTIEIMNTRDGVTAKMIAETPQVKEILDKSIESLKNTIASQGVNVNNISVKVEQTASSQQADLGFEQEQFNREASQHSHQNNHENSGSSPKGEFTAFSNSELETEEADSSSRISQNQHNGEVNIRI